MQKLNNFPPLCMVEEGCNYFLYFVDVIREKLPTNAEERSMNAVRTTCLSKPTTNCSCQQKWRKYLMFSANIREDFHLTSSYMQ